MNRSRQLSLLTAAAGAVAAGGIIVAAAGPTTVIPVASAVRSAVPSSTVTITTRTSGVFDGIGAIAGGGGNARLLADYPPAVRNQIYDHLFRPGYGAALQMLKLEIGAGTYSSDGAEPSVEPTRGKVNCDVGYEWQLAQAAVRRNPSIQLYALQWGAPGWVGQDIWTDADVGYVITWLKCARQHHLRIAYIGGWNEHGPGLNAGRRWVLSLRRAMDANGFRSVRYVAADAFLTKTSGSGPELLNMLRRYPAYRQAVSVLGFHDSCRVRCGGPPSTFGKPVWESELGDTDGDLLASAINRAWITARTSGLLVWPAVDAIPPDLPYQNRGLVVADWPWSGYYKITPLAWVTAHTTQFTRPGWRYAWHASRLLPAGGSVVTYEHRRDWSAVAETASTTRPQQLTLKIDQPLSSATVHVWGSDLRHRRYLIRLPDRHGPTVTLTLRPGWLYTLTTTRQRRPTARPPGGPTPAPLPYTGARDSADLPSLLSPVQGSFSYSPSGQWFTQDADQEPVLSHPPMAAWNHPYALVGDDSWTDYTISTDVMFTGTGQSAGVLGRCHWPASLRLPLKPGDPVLTCYQLTASADGHWQLARITPAATVDVLASGTFAAPQAGTWTAVQLAMRGPTLTASVGGSQVAKVSDSTLTHGPAGITDSTWAKVGYRSLAARWNPSRREARLVFHDLPRNPAG
jgi:Glycosyl hydrolase family 59